MAGCFSASGNRLSDFRTGRKRSLSSQTVSSQIRATRSVAGRLAQEFSLPVNLLTVRLRRSRPRVGFRAPAPRRPIHLPTSSPAPRCARHRLGTVGKLKPTILHRTTGCKAEIPGRPLPWGRIQNRRTRHREFAAADGRVGHVKTGPDPRRGLPAVDRLADAVRGAAADLPAWAATAGARAALDEARRAAATRTAGAPPEFDALAATAVLRGRALAARHPRRVVNATGVVLPHQSRPRRDRARSG